MKNDTNTDGETTPGSETDQREGMQSESKPTRVSKPGQRGGKRFVRWTLWMLIVFGLGATAVMVFLYIPLQQKYVSAEANLTASSQQTSAGEQKIGSLTAQAADLATKNKDLQSQLDQANLYLAIINAKSDVQAASLAASNGNSVSARLSLEKATADMQSLASLLKDNNLSEVLATIQQNLELVKAKVNTDIKSAQPDLDVLIDNLSNLQDALKK